MFHLDSMNMKKMFWPNTTWISDYFLDLKRAAQSFQSPHQKETQLIHVKLLKSSSRPKRRKISARIRKRGIFFIKMTKQNQQQNNLSSALNDPDLSISSGIKQLNVVNHNEYMAGAIKTVVE